MKNFIEKEFIKYYLGDKFIRAHVDAVHAVPPYADQFTGEIVMGLINKINCSGIISKVSRKKIDLNRRRDVNNKEIIIGTRNGESCSNEIKEWFIEEINKYYENIVVDSIFPGDSSKIVHRLGDHVSDLSYQGYGKNYNTIQIEISRNLRENQQKELINILSNIILSFNKIFL